MKNLKNKNKILLIFIIVLALVLLIGAPISIVNYLKAKKTSNLQENSCTKYGNVCTKEEIFKGVEVLVEVEKGKKYLFNVISNTEKEMTLLLEKNLVSKVDWSSKSTNVEGPDKSLESLLDRTKDWENIPKISNYTYNDSGKINYQLVCFGEYNNILPEDYDCTTTTYKTRGYDSLVIKDGKLTLNKNLPEGAKAPSKVYKNKIARARMLTLEEVNALVIDHNLPSWLVKNLDNNAGFWTQSSGISAGTKYNQGAMVIENNFGLPILSEIYTKHYENDIETIGIRPVITIKKEK